MILLIRSDLVTEFKMACGFVVDRMETHVHELPEDILFTIFRHMLDGLTVLKCEEVCVRWRDVIRQLCKYSFWKLALLKEVGMNTAMELAGNTSVAEDCSEEKLEGRCVWKELYVKWQMSIRIDGKPFKSEFDWETGSCQFLPVDLCISFITCITMTETDKGVVFVTGHRDGHCILWFENDIKNARVVLTFDTEVKYVVVVNFKKLDGLDHKHVVVASICGEVKMFCIDNPQVITAINEKPLSRREQKITTLRIFGKQILLEFSYNNFVVYQLLREEAETCLTKVQEIPISELEISNEDFNPVFWDNKITYFGSNGPFADNDSRIENTARRRIPSKIFVFRNDIILFSSSILRVAILKEQYKFAEYNYDHLGYLVTAAHVYGGILALGSSTGVLSIFKFKKLDDLLELDFANPLYSLQICRNWISGITITTLNFKQIVVKVVANGYFKIIDLRWNIEI